jgi:hypothetical protein
VALSRFGTLFLMMMAMTFAFQNCAGSKESPSESPPDLSTQIDSLKSQIQILNQQDLSCTQDMDCKVFITRATACGGATGYLIASQWNPNYREIQSLIEQLAAASEQYDSDNQIVGSCAILAPPTPTCQQNQCQ